VSLRKREGVWFVLCDGPGCGVELQTSAKNGVLAFYEATLAHDWQEGPDSVRGVYHPECFARGRFLPRPLWWGIREELLP
jgi:hypothetical protein